MNVSKPDNYLGRMYLYASFSIFLACGEKATHLSFDRYKSTIESTNDLLRMSGPGLTATEFSEDELWQPIAWVDRNTFIPETFPFRKPFGSNVAMLLDGYKVSMFTPDSGNGPGGFLVLDISDPRNPQLVQRIYEPNGRTRNFREPHAYGLALIDDKKLLAIQTGRGIEIWDFSDINKIDFYSRLDLNGINFGDYSSVAWQLWWQHPYMYVSASNQGVFLIDTSDPKNPKLANRGAGHANPIPTSELGGFRVGPIFTLGNLLVISSMDVTEGFASFDISDPYRPKLLGRLETLPTYYAICFDGRYLHATVRGRGALLHSYDLIDPRQPKLVSNSLRIDEQLYCAMQDHYVFVGAQESVHKVDMLGNDGFTEIGQGRLGVNFPDNGQVTVFGNLLFVGNDHGTGSALMPHSRFPDREPPKLIRSLPANGAINQSTKLRIGLAFSDNILPESLTPNNLQLLDENDQSVAGDFSVQMGLVNFSPRQELKSHHQYRIHLRSNGLRDYAGNVLADEIEIRFQTGGGNVDSRALISSYSFIPGEDDDLSYRTHQLVEGALRLLHDDPVQLPADFTARLAGSVTLSFYIRTTQSGERRAWEAPGLLGADASIFRNDMFWGWLDQSGRIRISTGNDDGAGSRFAINDGQWHHITMSRDSLSGELRLYRNGVLEGTTRGQRGLISNPLTELGRITPQGLALVADIDEIRIFNEVLSDSEVLSLNQNWLPQLKPRNFPLRQDVQDEIELSLFDIRGLSSSTAELSWDLGDGTVFKGSRDDSWIHRYQSPGSYQIRLTIADGSRTDTWNWPIRVISTPREIAPLSSSPIQSDERNFYLVNPDSNTVSAFAAETGRKIWEVDSGLKPRTLALGPNDNLWVSAQDSDELIQLSRDDGDRINSIFLPYGSAPYGLIVTDDAIFASLEGSQQLIKLDQFGDIKGRIDLGFKPRGLAFDPNGQRLFVSRFISSSTEGEIWQIDPDNLRAVRKLSLPLDSTTADGEDRGRGLANYLVQIVLTPDGQRLFAPAKKDNIVRGRWRSGEDLNHENTVRAVMYQWQHGQDYLQQQFDFNDREGPVAIAFTPEGDYAFVALQGSNSVEIIDILRGSQVGAIDQAGFTPQGLSISPDGRYLGIQAFLSRSILIYDLQSMRLGQSLAPQLIFERPSTNIENLSTSELQGKKVFYHARDSRMSRDGYISCASCHLDDGDDGQVWDFTERGEGLRRTISLKGRQGMGFGPVHWTANFDEIQDFENDIRFAFGGTGFMLDVDFELTRDPLGLPKAGFSIELDTLASYVASLRRFPRSPYRTLGGDLSDEALNGKLHFHKYGCESCHSGPEYTDQARHDVGTIRPWSGLGIGLSLQGVGFKTPSLLGVWSRAPYLHDGTAANIEEAILAHSNLDLGALNAKDLYDLSRYIKSLD